MQRSEIIELANQLTERKGEKILNLPTLYRFVLQDICKRQRFWWRRVLVTFQMAIGTTTYDFTNAALFPSLAELAIEEITKFSLILTPSPLQTAELSPVFDPQTLIEMTFNTSSGQPGRYTMQALDYKTLLVDPPDQNYTAFIVGWAMPNPASDSPNDAVPLIPTWGHNTIVLGLIAAIFSWQYGSENPKTLDAQAKYEQAVLDLESKKQFDPNYTLQLTLRESAVRST